MEDDPECRERQRQRLIFERGRESTRNSRQSVSLGFIWREHALTTINYI